MTPFPMYRTQAHHICPISLMQACQTGRPTGRIQPTQATPPPPQLHKGKNIHTARNVIGFDTPALMTLNQAFALTENKLPYLKFQWAILVTKLHSRKFLGRENSF